MFSEDLSFLLSPALSAYELDASLGCQSGNDVCKHTVRDFALANVLYQEFQDAIKREVRKGHTFKVPLTVNFAGIK